MQKFTKQHKHHFQLLEVMIAVFLIMICVVPTFEIFTNMYKHEADANLINQRDHYVRLVHAHLIEKLYKNEIPIEEIARGFQSDLSDSDLNEKIKKIGYTCSYEIKGEGIKRKEKIRFHLCNLKIHMSKKNESKNFLYIVYIDRGERAGLLTDEADSDSVVPSPSNESVPKPETLTSSNPNKKERDKNSDGDTDYSSSGSDYSSSSSDNSSYSSDDDDDSSDDSDSDYSESDYSSWSS